MQNADGVNLLAAEISFDAGEAETTTITLYKDYTDAEKEEFLRSLDFNYNAGFGSQKLFGTIWYGDGSYSERSEYDGSEWWTRRSTPPVPTKK